MVSVNGSSAEKELDTESLRKSVIDRPDKPDQRNPSVGFSSSLVWFAQTSDLITPWGMNPKQRDRELREFITSEPIFAGALAIVCSRNAAFSWTMEGPERTVRKFSEVFEEANFGAGWVDLVTKVSLDLYTQDNGAFIEIVRERDSEGATIVGLNHLDSARCWHTGAPEAPVIYLDRKGKYHLLKWYQVIELSEMPVAIEGLYGQQYCALTRLFRAAQIIKNISIYDDERTGGRFTRALHILRGVTTDQVNSAIQESQAVNAARGLMRYSQPVFVGSVDPTANVGHDTLELAGLPDNFNREEAFKWYISQIAMAFLEDYQTFAPLPGGNLGTSAQSEILHMKARGKGPGLFQKIITHAINFKILPDNIEFKFDEQDLDHEQAEADVHLQRANMRSVRIRSGEITPEAARVLAKDSGDLPEELFDALAGTDVTPDIMITDTSDPDAQLGDENAPRTTAYPEGEIPKLPPYLIPQVMAQQQQTAPTRVPGQPASRGGSRPSVSRIAQPSSYDQGETRTRRVGRVSTTSGKEKENDAPGDRDAVEDKVGSAFENAFARLRPRMEDLVEELVSATADADTT